MQFRPTNSMFEIFRTRSILRPCNIDARLLRKRFRSGSGLLLTILLFFMVALGKSFSSASSCCRFVIRMVPFVFVCSWNHDWYVWHYFGIAHNGQPFCYCCVWRMVLKASFNVQCAYWGHMEIALAAWFFYFIYVWVLFFCVPFLQFNSCKYRLSFGCIISISVLIGGL